MISNLETSILGLVCEGFSYGYELDKIIDERNMRHWTEIAFSSIYYVLKRLEKKGLITSGSERVSGRTRKIYSVTLQGEATMNEKVRELISSHHQVTDPFDLGIGNLHTLPFEDIIKGLKSYKESLDSREQFYRKRLEVMEESDWPHHIRGLVTRPLAMMDAERKWIQSYINDLEAHHEAKEELHGS
ncbi:PadR family transcriptional regulator [Candidatus Bathyarchaeota archaeon]|nr:PadR family transcriptional regulator [Candidatus Bathyarchaeota archaeon]MBT4321509.1 PadR family transcriptional regulator [Candidatus Bathyarchaeota archaeon]MBT4423936.1 PadR family transcriptional regulator [Candidatus Bathyarchaeota archaeon]MBT5642780.1 PadR family transcriptional regulator [Candidatus Bathyarchaeota archaeon]MBT6603992.1 PadR family transcriptional regulator [Candidatus Bathyarchaeota archaeon]